VGVESGGEDMGAGAVSDLTAFLAARLDELETSAARAWSLRDKLDDPHRQIDPNVRAGAEHAWHETAADPARMLREVEAGRRILARYEDCLLRMEDPAYPHAVARDQAREYEDFVLPNLLVRWADHPDYDPEWRP